MFSPLQIRLALKIERGRRCKKLLLLKVCACAPNESQESSWHSVMQIFRSKRQRNHRKNGQKVKRYQLRPRSFFTSPPLAERGVEFSSSPPFAEKWSKHVLKCATRKTDIALFIRMIPCLFHSRYLVYHNGANYNWALIKTHDSLKIFHRGKQSTPPACTRALIRLIRVISGWYFLSRTFPVFVARGP